MRGEREVATGGEPDGGAVTTLSSLAVNALGNAHIRVAAIGPDIAERVEDAVESYDAFEIGAFHVDLSLADPGAPTAADRTKHDRLALFVGHLERQFNLEDGAGVVFEAADDRGIDADTPVVIAS